MAGKAVMEIASMDEAIAWQADHADHSAAPCTARVVRAQRAVLATDTQVARRMTNWPGLLLADALPLRLAGGLHNLFLTGDAPKLGPVYAGELTEQAAIDALVARLVERFDARLSPWLDGPPQTNEAGRSAGIMAGLLWLAEKLGPRFEMNEIGASAGTNTMMDRFAFDLGGVKAGPETSPMRIAPEWRGPPPPSAPVEIAAIRGCDLNPVDLTNPAAALRLKSYVWAENLHRLERIDAAIALACEKAPLVDRADAGEWVVQRLVEPQASGVTRVLFHSIVWQYLPPATQERIERAMEEAGARASADRPLGWVQLETNRETFRHELRVLYWDGADHGWALLGQAHPHGAWVEWYGD